MPLIIVCGRPCTGKTRVAAACKAALEKEGKTVVVVNEESLGIRQRDGYKNGHEEKITRASLRAAVERHVAADTTVIADSMNYIKGFRYELYSLSRTQATQHCVLFVDTPQDVAEAWNETADAELVASIEAAKTSTDSPPDSGSGSGSGAGAGSAPFSTATPSTSAADTDDTDITPRRYEKELFENLWTRLEPPEEGNRWDSPLFRVDADCEPEEMEAVLGQVCTHIITGVANKPQLSTKVTHIASTNTLHEMEKKTQEMVAALKAALRTAMVGEAIPLPHTTTKVLLFRRVTAAEVTRLRREFMKLAKAHIGGSESVPNLFVDFLNRQLET